MTMGDDPWARSPRAEAWVVLVDEDPETGARRVRRRPLNMPLAVATAPLTADGGLDLSSARISNRVISDLLHDLEHEQHRRAGTLHELGHWDRRPGDTFPTPPWQLAGLHNPYDEQRKKETD